MGGRSVGGWSLFTTEWLVDDLCLVFVPASYPHDAGFVIKSFGCHNSTGKHNVSKVHSSLTIC